MFYVLDFETYWDSKSYTLSKIGPVEYVRDERFAPQLLAVSRLDQPAAVDCYSTESGIAAALAAMRQDPQAVLIGHNLSGFDVLILSERYGWKPVHIWDTIGMANWTGVSRLVRKSHAAMTDFFGNGVKQAGTVVSDGKHWPHDFTHEEQQFFVQYCCDDARQCALNAGRMLPYMTADALQFMSITARMATEPVFVLDKQMLADYIDELEASVRQARAELLTLFHFPSEEAFLASIRSAPKFAVMLTSLGVVPPTKVSEAKTATRAKQFEAAIAAATSEADRQHWRERMERELPVMTYAFSKQDIDFLALCEHEDPRVRLLVETRLAQNSSIVLSRAKRFYTFACYDKPVPVMLSAFNAHTGRYTAGSAGDTASDRLQFQNLSKRDPGKAKLRQAIKAPAGCKVVACDSSQVEARCLAWVANETGLVAQFREGRDPYSELAGTIFGVPHADIHYGAKHGDKKMKQFRNVGKAAILSAGYQSGAAKFSDMLLRSGAKLSEDLEKHKEMAFHAHAVYRAAHPNIVAFWNTCSHVIAALAQGYAGKFGGPHNDLFEFGPMTVCGVMDVPSIKLPSGFILRYPNLHCEEIEGKAVYVYDTVKGSSTIKTKVYGGLLTNNCIQSFAFQILMWQACRMDDRGIRLAANIHDSFATVVPEDKAEETAAIMLECMSTVPPWAPGLPIAAEFEIGTDFAIV